MSIVFTAARGRVVALCTQFPDAGVAVLLKVAEPLEDMADRETLADLLSGDNVEADFTGYVRLTDLSFLVQRDTINSAASVDAGDFTWPDAGGLADNGLVALIVGVKTGDSDGDDDVIPLTAAAIDIQTDGSPIELVPSAGVFWRSE